MRGGIEALNLIIKCGTSRIFLKGKSESFIILFKKKEGIEAKSSHVKATEVRGHCEQERILRGHDKEWLVPSILRLAHPHCQVADNGQEPRLILPSLH